MSSSRWSTSTSIPGMRAAPAETPAGFRHWLRLNAWRIGVLFAGVLLPLGVFAALADEIHELEALFFDEPLLQHAHALASPGLDAFFVLMARLGYAWGVVPADALLTLVLLARRHWREATFAGFGTAGSGLLNLLAKQLFQRDRPSLWESIAPESTFSFPSGHAMGSMALAAVLVALSWRTRARWWVLAGAVAFVVSVGASRIYLGVHYPSDILGGWCAALAWVTGLYLLMFRGTRRPRWWHRRTHRLA